MLLCGATREQCAELFRLNVASSNRLCALDVIELV
jgi:hypothetical protein